MLNLGSTCYLNSVIQSLRHCEIFTHKFLNHMRTETTIVSNNDTILSLIGLLSQHILSPTQPQNIIQDFKKSIDDKPQFKTFQGNNQHDSHEFLVTLLDYLHETLGQIVHIRKIGNGNRNGNGNENMVENRLSAEDWLKSMNNKYSVIADIFYGQFKTVITCCENQNHVFKRFDPFQVMDIDVICGGSGGSESESADMMDEEITITNCLRKYFQKEVVNDYFCEKCNKKVKNALIEKSIFRFPNVLIIKLNRWNTGDQFAHKSSTAIDIHPLFQLNKENKYRLQACICHLGSTNGGHYLTIICHRKTYVIMDDMRIVQINEEIANRMMSNDSYILFYEKIFD